MPRTASSLAAALTGAALLLTMGTLGVSAVASPLPAPVRVNAGGPAGTYEGLAWRADSGFSRGRASVSTDPIKGTTSSALYQRRRVDPGRFSLPVTNGQYSVSVHTAETYFHRAGQRIFSVTAEDSSFISDLDLIRTVGHDTAHTVTRTVEVKDGSLTLNFSAKVNLAVVGAITVKPVAPPAVAPSPSPTTSPSPSPAPAPAPAPAPTASPLPSTTAPAPAPAPAPSVATPPAPAAGALMPPLRSGLAWRSGVYVPGSTPARHEAFGTWRGNQLDVVVDWPARSTWNDIVSPTWLYDRWKGTPYTKVFGVAPLPEGDSTATLARCASGAYNDKWRQFGTGMKAAGLDDETIIRLGWEMNGNWYKWSAHDPEAFAACWRQIHTSAESTAPALRWDWTVNRGPGQSVSDPRRAWPGDAYVDVVGVDSYDGWPGATTESAWQSHYSGAYGLKFWADFAREKGKLFSVPEWGVYPGTAWAGNNGGDNPFYVTKMADFFYEQRDVLAYEAYFNESASYYAGSIFSPQQAPRAGTEYLRRW